MEIYSHELSGNSYKVRLLLALLNVPYELITVDLRQSAQKRPEYLAKNPFGQLPLLEDGEVLLADAQAILVYLARTYGGEQWLPTDAVSLSRIVRWLSIAAGEIRQGPESARLYHLFGATAIPLERTLQKSQFILGQLDRHLSDRRWLELDRPTIADVVVFPYIALASDGQISLDEYPHIQTWIERVKNLPGFVGMPGIPAAA